MALSDLQAFLKERALAWSPTLDLSDGSPFDAQVIQPLLRRVGTDPFTVDAATFILQRLVQQYPDLASSDGDAVSDTLLKPLLLLWDPIIREIQRVKAGLTAKDPSTLTADEADALGANLFAQRATGTYTKGRVRMYFSQPQDAVIAVSNFFTSSGGLHFFPISVQSIKALEMQPNFESGLYYFDIDTVAESTGDQYNIGPSEIVTVANFTSAVRVTNKTRFKGGIAEQDSVSFIDGLGQDLTERSLVTARGIVARLLNTFSELTRINVAGFNDPEMQRDVITGGSLGPIVASGMDAASYADGEFKLATRRVKMPSANFFSAIGPAGAVTGWVLTLGGMFSGAPFIRDVAVGRVIDGQTLELVEQIVRPGVTTGFWTLRKIELSLSNIPGGILFPNGPTGTLLVPPGEIHIGGCVDTFIRGNGLDTTSLQIDVLADEQPLLTGMKAAPAVPASGYITLTDLVLSPNLFANYSVGDDTYQSIELAGEFGYQIQILDGVAAGVYRVISVVQAAGASPILQVSPTPLAAPGTFRWRLINEIHVDLASPKQTRVSGSTGSTTQSLYTFTTTDAVDFFTFGVGVGDTLRLLSGNDAGDFVIKSIDAPFYTRLTVDRPFQFSSVGVNYTVFRPNAAGGVQRPLIRITSIDLLDTTGQSVGVKVPYAKPVEVRSNSFQNVGAGTKKELVDALLGIVSLPDSGSGYVFGLGGSLMVSWDLLPTPVIVTVSGTETASAIVTALNVQSQILLGLDVAVVLQYGGANYVGILPVGPSTTMAGSTIAVLVALFGNTQPFTSRDIHSVSVPDWSAISPGIDSLLDTIWVQDGVQNGFYDMGAHPIPLPLTSVLRSAHDFSPEIGRALRVGSRSIGSVRLYFLDPTSMEVDQGTVFTAVDANGVLLNFKPDPTLPRQKLPALPNGLKPLDGVTSGGGTTFTSASTDFLLSGIQPGDILRVDYIPVLGTTNLPDPVPAMALRQIRLSLANQPDKLITFVNDVSTAGAVSLAGIAAQINSAAGLAICSIVSPAPGINYLQFNPTALLIIRQQLTNPASANATLGFSNTADTNNESPNAGDYTIATIAPGGLQTTITVVGPGMVSNPGQAGQQFSVLQDGVQRISTSQMSSNTDTGSLYYWDVDLVSEGPGNNWNLVAGQLMAVSNFRSDGYYLNTQDSNLTFSEVEDIEIHFSPSVLEVGVDDDPQNSTTLTGQSVSINYEYSSSVQNTQAFESSESERANNASPLVRHLVPHYMRMNLTYFGGSRSDVVTPGVESLISSTLPDAPLEASAIQQVLTNNGATYVQNPISMIAVVYNFDRTVVVARSEDQLSTGRLSTFIPDIITLTRKVSS